MLNRFEGWYFKQQSGQNMIAFIPAVHTDRRGNRSGSVQVITPDKSYYIEFPEEAITINRQSLVIRAGESTFSPKGIALNIQSDGISVTGNLQFGKMTPPNGDIMGPYKMVPFMECRHSVFSLTHTVLGSLTVNGRLLDFSDGVGYMEGDRGSSFPKRYVWTQCNWFDEKLSDINRPGIEACSLMLSAAEVKPLGRAFMGIIGFVYYKGREIRIATYHGAKVLSIGSGAVTVQQGDYTLTAQLLDSSDQSLRAPTSGEMVRLIKESLSCRARYIFSEKNKILFDFISDNASFEYEY